MLRIFWKCSVVRAISTTLASVPGCFRQCWNKTLPVIAGPQRTVWRLGPSPAWSLALKLYLFQTGPRNDLSSIAGAKLKARKKPPKIRRFFREPHLARKAWKTQGTNELRRVAFLCFCFFSYVSHYAQHLKNLKMRLEKANLISLVPSKLDCQILCSKICLINRFLL